MRFVSACLLCLIYTLSYTQEKKTEIDVDLEKSSLSSFDLASFVNKKRDRVCIVAEGNSSVKGYILDSSYKVLKQFSLGKEAVSQLVTGGFFAEEKVHFFLARDKDDDRFFWYTYDMGTGMHTIQPVDLDRKKEMFVGGLSLGDQFAIVTVKKREDEICVYRFNDKGTYTTLRFSMKASLMGYPGLYEALSSESGFSRASEVTYINDWESPSVDKAKTYCKLYYRTDSMFITIDREKNKTWVLTLDLSNQKINSRLLTRNFVPCPQDFQTNTFLLDRHLYTLTCCSDAMGMLIQDFYTGEVVKQHAAGRDEDISFRNTDIVQEGGFYDSGEKKLEKTKQLLRKMTNGRPVIVASNTDSSRVELTVGSYKEMRSGGGMAMPMGGVMLYAGFSREWTKSARFKSLLDAASFEKREGQVKVPAEEKIEKLTKDVKIPEGCEGVFPMHNKLHYYYLDKKALKLVVMAL
jgi:hypothetical protein